MWVAALTATQYSSLAILGLAPAASNATDKEKAAMEATTAPTAVIRSRMLKIGGGGGVNRNGEDIKNSYQRIVTMRQASIREVKIKNVGWSDLCTFPRHQAPELTMVAAGIE